MNEGLIPRRYAKALFLVAKERKLDEKIYDLMKVLETGFAEQPALDATLNNPYVSSDDKCRLILTAVGIGKADCSLLTDFLRMLVENRRIGMMRLIAIAYVRLYREERGIYKVDVRSAAPLKEADEQRLKRLVERHLHGGTMEYSHSVDPSLIGGFTVSVGNEIVDASVSNELKQLRLNLLSK